MNRKKIKVALLFGGRSAEHEVSLQSALNVAEAIDKKKYQVNLVGIDKSGEWFLGNRVSEFILNPKDPKKIALNKKAGRRVILPGDNQSSFLLPDSGKRIKIDAVFPILHGPFGEDGTIQGLLKLANIPFVGAGVLGSAVGMDKEIMKRLLREAGIPIGKFLTVKDKKEVSYQKARKTLGKTLFVKPANLGSSVGVSKVRNQKEFKKALDEAFKYDNRVLIEEEISGREIECSVLGNEKPEASVPGEVVSPDGFYSYKAKYIDENGAEIIIPAKLSKKQIKEIQNLSVKTFQTLSCQGLARVDMFLTKSGKILVNEINTIPGFTSISMYPKLWEESGISYSQLIDRLIKLSLERFKKEKRLR